MSKNREIVETMWRLLETNRLDRLEEVFAGDGVVRMPGQPELRGLDTIRGALGAYFEAFPDMKHEVVGTVESGDTIAVQLRVRGTHKGPMRTPKGTLPPSGKPLDLESCDVVRVHDGKIVAWQGYYDNVAMMTAVGAI